MYLTPYLIHSITLKFERYFDLYMAFVRNMILFTTVLQVGTRVTLLVSVF